MYSFAKNVLQFGLIPNYTLELILCEVVLPHLTN